MLVLRILYYFKPLLFKYFFPAGVYIEPFKLLNNYNSNIIETINNLKKINKSINLEFFSLISQQKGKIQ